MMLHFSLQLPAFRTSITQLLFFVELSRNVPTADAICAVRFVLRNAQVHARGSLFESPDELLKKVTGDVMQPRALVNHLRAKYTEIYDL